MGFPRAAAHARGYGLGMTNSPAAARYRIAIHRARGCYFAQVIDLPGCFSRGATEVEAVENARCAIRAYLWVAQALAGDKATVQLEISA
jgi:predicted RNase H-like HicB family nuclease